MNALSRRERQIVEKAAQGLTDRQIAGEFGLAVGTLNTYWTRIRAKTNLRTRGEIIGAFTAHSIGAETVALEQQVAQLKQRLLESRSLIQSLQSAIDGQEVGIGIIRRDGEIVSHNRRFRSMVHPEDTMGKRNHMDAWSPQKNSWEDLLSVVGDGKTALSAQLRTRTGAIKMRISEGEPNGPFLVAVVNVGD